MIAMNTQSLPRIIPAHPGRRRSERQIMVPVKMSDAERVRFKVACAEEGNLSYADLIVKWLDDRDAKIEATRRRQAHPLHRPTDVAAR